MPFLTIVDGPSKWHLILSLFDHLEADGEPRKIEFRLDNEPGVRRKAIIDSCKRLPGEEFSEAHDWELAGRINIRQPGSKRVWHSFTATYSTKTRSGSLEPGQ